MTEEESKQGRSGGGPSRRLASWLAWAGCALSLTLTALNFVLIELTVSPNTPAYAFWPELTSPRGRLLGDRRYRRLAPARPAYRLDLLRATGLIAAVDHFAGEYAVYALLAFPHPLPGGRAML